jgi:hypothetical protein
MAPADIDDAGRAPELGGSRRTTAGTAGIDMRRRATEAFLK